MMVPPSIDFVRESFRFDEVKRITDLCPMARTPAEQSTLDVALANVSLLLYVPPAPAEPLAASQVEGPQRIEDASALHVIEQSPVRTGDVVEHPDERLHVDGIVIREVDKGWVAEWSEGEWKSTLDDSDAFFDDSDIVWPVAVLYAPDAAPVAEHEDESPEAELPLSQRVKPGAVVEHKEYGQWEMAEFQGNHWAVNAVEDGRFGTLWPKELDSGRWSLVPDEHAVDPVPEPAAKPSDLEVARTEADHWRRLAWMEGYARDSDVRHPWESSDDYRAVIGMSWPELHKSIDDRRPE